MIYRTRIEKTNHYNTDAVEYKNMTDTCQYMYIMLYCTNKIKTIIPHCWHISKINSENHRKRDQIDTTNTHVIYMNANFPVALFTKILTIKNCRKCKTKIKKRFTKILTIILSVKIVLTLRVKLPCPKSKILIVREILVLSFIVKKKLKKRWTMYWPFDLKIREQFIVSAFSLTV